jgi:hypothetical protein
MQPRHRLFQRRLINVGEHDTCSPAGELRGSGEPDAIRTAGDYSAFSFELSCETVHGATLTDRREWPVTAPRQ